ncbi:MAG: glycosyltransferase family 39 protein [Rhodobacterales bacterium]|nr:glycosyltransferase family 39 protein [Rhodobacterales bacterium]
MPTAAKPGVEAWLPPALAIVAAVTAARLALLAVNGTDLFVDEAQYWLWGQSFAWGYYSKPPMIGWVIGLSTALGGDGTFWVRAPFPLFQGAAALVLAALAAQVAGARAAVWTAAAYVTLPMAAVGSLLASTDSVMAPFFAVAILAHLRLCETRAPGWAVAAGVATGLAILSKYAGAYLVLGYALAAIWPDRRPGWRNAALLALACAVLVAPNLWWNLQNGLATLQHTADNVGWVRQGAQQGLNPAGLAEFVGAQFGVMGPGLFAAWLVALARGRRTPPALRRLLPFSLPAFVIVCGQALAERAYANWAASAWLAGTVVAVGVLLARPRLLALAVGVNAAVALALPVLTVFPGLAVNGTPVLERYLGRRDLSLQILDAARATGQGVIVADKRDVLADLFHTGRDSGLSIHARPPTGRPMNHYEQAHPLPAGQGGTVLLVTAQPPVCDGAPVAPAVRFDTAGGTYRRQAFAGYVIAANCLAR